MGLQALSLQPWPCPLRWPGLSVPCCSCTALAQAACSLTAYHPCCHHLMTVHGTALEQQSSTRLSRQQAYTL